jgi:hypothetical protein
MIVLHREVIPYSDDEGEWETYTAGEAWYELRLRLPDWLGSLAFFVQRWR